MSSSRSDKRQLDGQGPGRRARPATDSRSVHTVSLLVLLVVVFVVALLMVISLAEFVFAPDPAVKAGPMYVTLALITGATILMLIMALNATYLPIMSRERAPNVHLVMWAMGITGVVTGLLTVGQAASPFAMRFVLGSIAFVFITLQNTRLARARAAAPTAQAGPPAPQAKPHPRGRQRRAGRKR